MVKHPIALSFPESEDKFRGQAVKMVDLLEELHAAYLVSDKLSALGNIVPQEELVKRHHELYEEWMTSGEGMVEPIFYGSEGAWSFQFLEMAEARYKNDSEWIESYLGTTLESIVEFAKQLEQMVDYQERWIGEEETFEQRISQLLAMFCFEADDIQCTSPEAVSSFLSSFSVKPGKANEKFLSIGDYNKVHSHPIIRLDDGKYYLPIFFYLARSIYESPYYWMTESPDYRVTARKNRGDATEQISFGLMRKAFGEKSVFRDVKIRKDGQDVTDIDVLALCGNKAVIVQAKSKKLTVKSRQGDAQSLQNDFKESVQSAYGQALLSRKALLDDGYEFYDCQGSPISVAEGLDDAYVVCVSGEHYPVLNVHVARYLDKSESDPFPVAVSIFDLELLAHYLGDPFEFTYYIRQRVKYSNQIRSIYELSTLAFHLKCKLMPREEAEHIWVTDGFVQVVEAGYLVYKGKIPRTNPDNDLTCEWKTALFDEVLTAINKSGPPEVTDAIFFLYDLASESFDEWFGNAVQKALRMTPQDRKPSNITIPFPNHRKGISFVCYSRPEHPAVAERDYMHLQGFALARKYTAYADEWLAFGSFEGSPNLIDLVAYSKAPWRSDPEMEELASVLLKPGKALSMSGKKPQRKTSRNQPCPCGSGVKFKRCHGR